MLQWFLVLFVIECVTQLWNVSMRYCRSALPIIGMVVLVEGILLLIEHGITRLGLYVIVTGSYLALWSYKMLIRAEYKRVQQSM